jgi:undecaprenyl-diphosphatase
MTVLKILVLAIVQGLCELLPVSSSAHVIVAERLMGLDPTTPDMTLLLVALHTGTMFAVILYFRREWRAAYFSAGPQLLRNAAAVVLATAATGAVGLGLLHALPAILGVSRSGFEIEQLFGNPTLIGAALAAAGALILVSGLLTRERSDREDGGAGSGTDSGADIGLRGALAIGAVQGLCLPFRGFSRSGATISTGLLLGAARRKCEEFSFALAVVLTPVVLAREVHRFLKASPAGWDSGTLLNLAWPSLLGMAASFAAGWLALRWLSGWLEKGRWHYFGVYCLAAASAVLALLR